MASSRAGRSPAWRFTRKQVKLARTAPELVPALVWLIALSRRSELSRYVSKPPDDELAAVVILMGADAKTILETTVRGRRIAKRLRDVSEVGLLKVRARAATRLGFGIESLLDV